MIIPNIWESKKCSKPPARLHMGHVPELLVCWITKGYHPGRGIYEGFPKWGYPQSSKRPLWYIDVQYINISLKLMVLEYLNLTNHPIWPMCGLAMQEAFLVHSFPQVWGKLTNSGVHLGVLNLVGLMRKNACDRKKRQIEDVH